MQTRVVYDKPVIIEARLNEFAPRSAGNPNVPYSAKEIVIDVWDPKARAWETLDSTYHNPRSYLKSILETFKEMKKNVLTICWDTGHVRTARKFQEMGLLQRNTLWELFMGGERLPGNAGVSLTSLQALRRR